MAAADRHLLFGLLALQTGIINQGQLVAAFQAWTLDKSRSLADHLEARGDLTSAKRAVLDALAAVHLETHGGNVEQSLAAVPSSQSTRASLAGLREPEIEATLARIAPSKNGSAAAPGDDDEADRTTNYSVGTATSVGQRFRVLRPHAKGGLGAVFVALDAELNREVALKQILDNHADDAVSRAPVPARGRDHRRAGTSRDRPGVRPGHLSRRPPLLRDAVHPGRQPQGGDRRVPSPTRRHGQRPAAGGRSHLRKLVRTVPRCVQRDRVRAQPGRLAPRREAEQHHRRQSRRDAGCRLGFGQGARTDRARRRVRRTADGSFVVERECRDASRQCAGDAGLHEP